MVRKIGGDLDEYYTKTESDARYLTEAELDTNYLSKITDDTAAGAITFEGKTTHEDGIEITGGTYAINSTSSSESIHNGPVTVNNTHFHKS